MINRNDAAGILHTNLILDGTGNRNIEYVCWFDRCTALADLPVMRKPTVVDQRTGCGNLTAEQ